MKTAHTTGPGISLRPLSHFVKLTTFLLVMVCMQVQANGFAQQKINLKLHKATLKQLLNEVEKQTLYRFVYHTGTLPADKKLDISVRDADLDQVLSQAFKGLPLNYSVKEDNLVVVFSTAQNPAQDKTVKGTVTGPDGKPLAGVSVLVTGTSAGTTTDANGNYSLQVPDKAKTLEFTLVGYVEELVSINKPVINVTMRLSATNLNEVVVTGYTSYSRNKSVSAATTIGGDKINDVPAATFEQALQGRVPGLNISSISGQPGTSARVLLRGVGSIAGNNDVLYVMDGVPIESGAFMALNPGDIESVTVLKDASAKAIYGSRGSNGVIVITTKRGKAGKLALEYRSQYGVSALTSTKFRMMNSAERKQFEEEIGLETGSEAGPFWTYSKLNPDYSGKSPAEQAAADRIVDSLLHMNTDWRDLFMRNGKFMEQQISASGGNQNIRFYTSLNYFDQQGLVKVSDLKRYTLKNNLDFTYGKFSANLNLNIGYSKSNLIQNENGTGANNPLSAVYYALPYEYPYAPDGKLVTTEDGDEYPVFDLREGSDSYARMLNTTNKQDQLKTVMSMSLSYTIARGLVAKTRLGVDYRDITSEQWINPDSYAGRRVSNGRLGSFGEGISRRTSLVSTSGFTYNNVFNDDHDIEVSALYEFLSNKYRRFNYTGFGLDSRLPHTPAGIGDPSTYTPTLGGGRTENAMSSLIGLARYTFMNKYTLNASYRYDGSSTLPEHNRWHGFYSFGVSWEAKREDFLANVNAISNLRFRTSYGTTASPFPLDFAYLATYGLATYGGENGIVPTTMGNPNYDWEYAKELNIGFDLGLIQNRIRLTAEYYNRITSNLFLDQKIPAPSGFTELSVSSGKMRNRGVEIDLQADVVKNRDLVVTVGGNMGYNKNTVLELGGETEMEFQYTGILRPGLPYGAHYAPKWAGVNPANGDPQYYTRDGQITTNYDANTLSVAEFGTYIPVITGGFNAAVTWKDFYFNALFSFNAKVMRYNNEDYFNENPSFTTSNQSVRFLYDRWKKPGDNAILPRIDAPRNYTSRDIQDASYVRLRNVNIGYNLPKSLISKWKFITGVQINLQGQNLLTWTKWRGFDPENGNEYARFSYPSPRTYVVGLNVNF
ncbi:TonB-dependent receptor [Pseudobacter ginsenosidimutans]|uniref:TonB-linked SusC/RagA family outer membrane protein n=1 Tax=Pseudobacter ginsenosidimutans TaxID=661488 RepID=A0A4Q7ML45_9BACT|nr:TonB-dependent receptor [Pseudobacter ginsenosidimutans]QEC40381.1 TonB-dependent receptor [Pseudobacter ginsenosidimutans]RZS69014.1 TonB-linked SusC/RagA family outer membrane protein [Pseudobacter ginsenosidimutans]